MKLSDYVVDLIQRSTGAEHVFMLSGGMAMHLVESFGSHPKMKVVPVHHEQAAGIAAASYARIREAPGVALVTAGPGALNAVNPCGGAWMESTPLVIVSGQVSRENSTMGRPLRQRGIQEVEIIDVVKPITKYAVKITDPQIVRKHLERGLRLMREGRPGPVWFDIPVDVQGAEIDPAALEADIPEQIAKPAVSRTEVESVIARFLAAERPLLVLGGGFRLSGSAPRAGSLVEAFAVPFQTTWNGMDLVAADHPLNFGRANVFGPRYANMIIQNADFVLAIGARFGIQHTGYNVKGFARGATLAMVDVDEAEMDKPGLETDIKLLMDAGEFTSIALEALGRMGKRRDHGEWTGFCKKLEARFPIAPALKDIAQESYVNPFYFVDRLSDLMPADAMFPFGSSGMGHTVTGGIFRCRLGQRAYTFKGLAGMGYGLPSVVGAAVAAPGRPAFTLVGEGGLHLNVHELQTAAHHRLGIKVIVFNNGGYHSIHMTQNAYFKGHFVGSGPESGVSFPPMDRLAELYGFAHFSAKSNGEVVDVLSRFIALDGPAILEVFLDPMKALEPKVASMKREDGTMVSRPLEDMTPLLDREELASLMKIPLL